MNQANNFSYLPLFFLGFPLSGSICSTLLFCIGLFSDAQSLSAVSHIEALVNRPKVTEVHFQHTQTLPPFPWGGKHPCSHRCQRADPQFIHLCFEDLLLLHSGPLSKTYDLYHHDSGYNLNRGLAGSISRESELTEPADRIPVRWANLSSRFPWSRRLADWYDPTGTA